jgi:hypothetical protein
VSIDGLGEVVVAIEANRAMRVIVELHSHIVRLEVALYFRLRQKVNPIEQDRIIADLDVHVGRDDDLPPLDVVAVLLQGEAVKKFHKSASKDIILLLLGAAHSPLDLRAEGLPLLVGGCGGRLLERADGGG